MYSKLQTYHTIAPRPSLSSLSTSPGCLYNTVLSMPQRLIVSHCMCYDRRTAPLPRVAYGHRFSELHTRRADVVSYALHLVYSGWNKWTGYLKSSPCNITTHMPIYSYILFY